MQSRLSVFCERVMEAGWLMAAILAPLYFNVFSNRVFEPDKISLVRSIALFMALAWLVKAMDGGMFAPRASASARQLGQAWWQRLARDNVLALPTLALVIVYIVSSLASMAPMITLWGSYQRLQGTYSTFSYIVIFFLAASAIRRREQLDRVISVVILTSIPLSIYGIIEHLKLEFLPWGGDVTLRVTSTMGNPIFIAAYLIMAVPLALARFLERLHSFLDQSGAQRRADRAALAILPMAQAVVWFLLIYAGLSVYGRILLGSPSSLAIIFTLLVVLTLTVTLPFTVRKGLAFFIMSSFYGAVVFVQLATIVFSQSRGPQLGLAAGLVVFVFLYALKWNSKVILYSGLALAVVAMSFLVAINLPNSPLAFVRDVPYIGRLGTLIDEGGGSTAVRSLIWQGARQLIGLHEPIVTPEQGPDALNALRPLIGYGPDAMYVAYNRFYPPELAHHEARNASPDRSHNETFDALVMTGILGYFAYWVVFYTAIYIALVYLRVIKREHGRYLYLALLVSGVVALLILYGDLLPIKFTPGPPLLGVLVLGIYLIITGLFTYDWKSKQATLDLLLIGLVSAIVAHFIEIQFGIAIASTRTHFWLFAALVVVAGRLNVDRVTAEAEVQPAAQPAAERPLAAAATRQPAPSASFSKKKGRHVAAGRRDDARSAPARRATPRSHDEGLWPIMQRVAGSVLPLAIIGGIILATMAYNFMLPPNSQAQPAKTTSVQFWLYFVAWLSCGIVVAFDRRIASADEAANERIAALVVYTAVSLAMWVLYVGLRAFILAAAGAQTDPISLVVLLYFVLFLFGLLLSAALHGERRETAASTLNPAAVAVYLVAGVIVLFLSVATNLNGILSDVHYKTGLAYDNARRFDGSIQAYQQAIRLAPSQDFYYLFLGRSFMELARQFPDRQANPPFDPVRESPVMLVRERLASLGRDDLIRASLAVLERARDLNPLNTDHYANLGRLHRFWGEVGDRSKLELADKYFTQATSLSPNNAQLWNEWAIISILRGRLDEGQAKLDHSLTLDDRYDLTYFYLGNLLMNQGENNQDATQRTEILTKAAESYGACLRITPTYWECAKARGYIFGKYLGRSQEAVADFTLVANALPKPEDVNRIADANDKQRVTLELINIHQNLAITYGQMGQVAQALTHAEIAAKLDPNNQALKALVEQLRQQKP